MMGWMGGLHRHAHGRSAEGDGTDLARPAAQPEDSQTARSEALVRSLLEEMNLTLLSGHGSVWDVPTRWGSHRWELWWGPTREGGAHLAVVLLRDSRGTPYLKIHRRRLALADTALDRRLKRALRAAFREPLK